MEKLRTQEKTQAKKLGSRRHSPLSSAQVVLKKAWFSLRVTITIFLILRLFHQYYSRCQGVLDGAADRGWQ